MVKHVKIKDHFIGKGHPIFLIAEMACAHQGIVQNAFDLVDVAVKANVNAIQLQLFKKEIYVSPIYKDYDLISSLELKQEEWLSVIKLIKKQKILFFAAGYDIESINFLIDNDVDAFKVHSSDLSNPEVLRAVARSGKVIFLSTGASTEIEVKKAIEFLISNGTTDIILMDGYQAYPTKIEDTHLKYIKTLKKTFRLNVGFYDHVDGGSELSKILPIMAIGYGACVIEKHFILTREHKAIDYESSLNPENFLLFCKYLRECEKAIGSEKFRKFTEDELNYRTLCKKSIVANEDIQKGEKITRGKLLFVRSEPGIPPDKFVEINGKIAKRNIYKNHNITIDDF